jgi:hypothetical protein
MDPNSEEVIPMQEKPKKEKAKKPKKSKTPKPKKK